MALALTPDEIANVIMLADFDPGTLTGFYLACLVGLVVVSCLFIAVGLWLAKKAPLARRWAIAAGIAIVLGILLIILVVSFGEKLHLM